MFHLKIPNNNGNTGFGFRFTVIEKAEGKMFSRMFFLFSSVSFYFTKFSWMRNFFPRAKLSTNGPIKNLAMLEIAKRLKKKKTHEELENLSILRFNSINDSTNSV